MELTRAEKHVHNFMMDTQLTKRVRNKMMVMMVLVLVMMVLVMMVIMASFAQSSPHP